MNIFILTCQEMANLGDDDSSLPNELKKWGFNPYVVVWDQFEVPDNSLVLMRTIWDYALKEESFKNLLKDFKTRNIRCINDIDTLLWNMDKSYMLELRQRKIPVVDTMIANNFSFSDLKPSHISFPIVLKPLVGASGVDTFLLESFDQVEDARNLLGRKVMIQPYIPSIKSTGEYSFIFFSGEFSHCVQKTASKDREEFRIQAEHGGQVREYKASPEVIEQARRVLMGLSLSWDYARVDMVIEKEQMLVMELELIEPELFFRFAPKSMGLFCQQLAGKYI